MAMPRLDYFPNTFASTRSDFRMKCADGFDSWSNFDGNSTCYIVEMDPVVVAFDQFDRYLHSYYGCCSDCLNCLILIPQQIVMTTS